MAEQWRELARMDGEEHARLYNKKAKIAVRLQDAIETIMDNYIEEGKNARFDTTAKTLEWIETIWRVLGLEYIQAAERQKLEREKRG